MATMAVTTTLLESGYQKMSVEVKLKRMSDGAIQPHKIHPSDAAFDLYADTNGEVVIYPHETQLIPTGFAMEIPEGYYGGIYARSGLASKNGLRPANCVGIVDCGYKNEVMVALHNDSNDMQRIKHGDRIAQFMIAPVVATHFIEVDELSGNDRGGGFGSSGV